MKLILPSQFFPALVSPRSTCLDNCHDAHGLHFPLSFTLLLLLLQVLADLAAEANSFQGLGSQQCSGSLLHIISGFLCGMSPCDFYALEDLGSCEISSGELATLNSMLCVWPQCWQKPTLFHSRVVTLLGTIWWFSLSSLGIPLWNVAELSHCLYWINSQQSRESLVCWKHALRHCGLSSK